MKNPKLLLLFAVFCMSYMLNAQNSYYTIDLATLLSGTNNIPDAKTGIIKINEYWNGDTFNMDGIRLLSPLSSTEYSIMIGSKKINEPESPLPLGARTLISSDSKKADTVEAMQSHPEFISLMNVYLKYTEVKSEVNIPSAFIELKNATELIHIKDIPPVNKSDSLLLKICDEIIQSKNQQEFKAELKFGKNVEISIVIIRPGLEIIVVVHMPEKIQRFHVHYGFTFSPESFSPSQQYYTKADTGSTFIITRMHGGKKNFLDNFTPTLQFSYSFYPKWKVNPILMGGIGMDFSNPTAMFGFGVMIGKNITVTSGLITARRNFLLGEYEEGQRVDTAISFDDLHRKMYVPEIFFSVGFRFDENPFKEEKKK